MLVQYILDDFIQNMQTEASDYAAFDHLNHSHPVVRHQKKVKIPDFERKPSGFLRGCLRNRQHLEKGAAAALSAKKGKHERAFYE